MYIGHQEAQHKRKHLERGVVGSGRAEVHTQPDVQRGTRDENGAAEDLERSAQLSAP